MRIINIYLCIHKRKLIEGTMLLNLKARALHSVPEKDLDLAL